MKPEVKLAHEVYIIQSLQLLEVSHSELPSSQCKKGAGVIIRFIVSIE